MKSTWEHFSATTTVGGLPQIYSAPHWAIKVIWFLVFLLFTGLTCYNSYTVFLDYYSYPVLTYVSVSYQRSLPFPAVTVCNLNPMPCSRLAAAYINEPKIYGRLFDLSSCIDTVQVPPLLNEVLDDVVNKDFMNSFRGQIYTALTTQTGSQQQQQDTTISSSITSASSSASATTQSTADPSQTSSLSAATAAAQTDSAATTTATADQTSSGNTQTSTTTKETITTQGITTQPTSITQSTLATTQTTETTAATTTTTASQTTVPPGSPRVKRQNGGSFQGGGGGSGPQITYTLSQLTNMTNLELIIAYASMYSISAVDGLSSIFNTALTVINGSSNSSSTSTTTTVTKSPEKPRTQSGPGNTQANVGFGPSDLTTADEDYLRAEGFLKNLIELHRQIGPDKFRNLSKPFLEFVFTCNFQGATCLNETYFYVSSEAEYGICYTFNSAFNPDSTYNGTIPVGVTGRNYGLTLTMLLSQKDYIPNSVAGGEGVRVVIHDPSVKPNPSDEGFSLRPNTETDAAMKLLEVSRLPAPYQSNCFSSWEETDYQPIVDLTRINESISIEYTYGACQSMCEAVHILLTCACLNPHNFRPFYYQGDVIGASEQLCTISKENSTDFICMNKVRGKLQSGELDCPTCSLPCDDAVYEYHLSAASWPASGYLDTVASSFMSQYQQMSSRRGASLNMDDMREVIKSEFIKLNVYFRTLNLETIEEEAKYDIWGFLSSLGGAVGLYLGMCGVSLIEIIQVIVLLIMAGACKLRLVDYMNDRQEKEARKEKQPGKDLMEKMFRLTDSARMLRERNVYPIRVPPVEQSGLY